jgi:hypothetical protein
MELDDKTLDLLADKIVSRLKVVPSTDTTIAGRWAEVPRRLTVPQFSACLNVCVEVVRRKIRSKIIPANLVEAQGHGYLIDRSALPKFNITPEVAVERLARWEQSQKATETAQTHEREPALSAA